MKKSKISIFLFVLGIVLAALVSINFVVVSKKEREVAQVFDAQWQQALLTARYMGADITGKIGCGVTFFGHNVECSGDARGEFQIDSSLTNGAGDINVLAHDFVARIDLPYFIDDDDFQINGMAISLAIDITPAEINKTLTLTLGLNIPDPLSPNAKTYARLSTQMFDVDFDPDTSRVCFSNVDKEALIDWFYDLYKIKFERASEAERAALNREYGVNGTQMMRRDSVFFEWKMFDDEFSVNVSAALNNGGGCINIPPEFMSGAYPLMPIR